MKKLLLLLTLIFSTTIFGQQFSYKVTYEGSNGDSLFKTNGTFKISKVRKTHFGFKKGILTIKTDTLYIKEKVVFFYTPYDNDVFFDIGMKPKNQKFSRIIGTPETMSFFQNDKMVYYLIIENKKRPKTSS